MKMTAHDIYTFILCFIVFSLLTAMFSYLITCITKMELELIKHGHRDEAIKKELKKKRENRVFPWINRIVSLLLCVILVSAFSFAVYIRATEGRPANGIPSIKVVKSESMAKKHPENTYLLDNNLNDQFQMFDVVVCNHLPAEDELKVYDVVVYKQDDMYVIHRIVGIEEPNANHPNERYFLLQGDAVDRQDRFPVLYSQMQGIYEGNRIPFVGSFILFLQSPAGWLCVLLVIFSMVVTPIVEKKIKEAMEKRISAFSDQLQKDAKEEEYEWAEV